MSKFQFHFTVDNVPFLLQLSPSSLPSSLVSLSLPGNEITAVVAPTSSVLLHLLTHLDLSTNLLETLPPLSSLCPALVRLDISNNAVGEISIEDMPKQLEQMCVDCRLVTVCIEAFNMNSTASRLLEGNLLDMMPEVDFSRLPKLSGLTLDDNLWECTCELAPFVR